MSSSIRAPQAAFSYDAVTLLGFGQPSPEALPEAKPGELILRYGGWSLQQLRDNKIVREKDLMWPQDWYNKYSWSAQGVFSGLFALRFPVPNSNCRSFDDQRKLLLPGEEPAPVVLAASALLAIRLSGGDDPLKGDWSRCREQTDAGLRVVLAWSDGRLRVSSYFGAYPLGLVWLASARRLSCEPCPSSP